MRLAIRGGRIVDPASNHDAAGDLFVADGRIVGLGAAPSGFGAEREIDARGLVVAPGLVDLCARMREPGAEGALKREMRAALAGGVTGVVCPPDTDPPLDEPGLVRMLRQRSREAAGARLYPLGALTAGLTGEVLAEIETLAEVGCVAFMQTGSLPQVVAVDALLPGCPPPTERVLDLVAGLHREGMGILHVTHSIGNVVDADRVLVMERGAIVLDDVPGTVCAVLAGGRFPGLGAPPVAALLAELRGLGWEVNPNVLSVREACREIDACRDFRGESGPR